MVLGVAIGAITCSGSVIAFLKLNGNMSGAPIMLPARHVINLGTLVAILGLIVYFLTDQSPWVFWTITGLSFVIGFLLIIRSEEHTSELQSLMRISYAVFCLKKKITNSNILK